MVRVQNWIRSTADETVSRDRNRDAQPLPAVAQLVAICSQARASAILPTSQGVGPGIRRWDGLVTTPCYTSLEVGPCSMQVPAPYPSCLRQAVGRSSTDPKPNALTRSREVHSP